MLKFYNCSLPFILLPIPSFLLLPFLLLWQQSYFTFPKLLICLTYSSHVHKYICLSSDKGFFDLTFLCSHIFPLFFLLFVFLCFWVFFMYIIILEISSLSILVRVMNYNFSFFCNTAVLYINKSYFFCCTKCITVLKQNAHSTYANHLLDMNIYTNIKIATLH